MKLRELKARYNTDKSEDYLDHYETFMAALTDKPIRLLELGVFGGESLRLWREYFPKGLIVGLDRNKVVLPESEMERIFIYQGLQDDVRLLDQIAAKHAPEGFDIIVDDASHIGSISRASFEALFDRHLKKEGLYAIEDWGTGYWAKWPDGAAYSGSAHNSGMIGLIKELVDECGWGDISKPGRGVGQYRQSKILRMSISHGQAILIKR